METISNNPMESLLAHGIRPSVQRLAVMGYLLNNHTHPTVEEIYNALIGDIPTLSKATVYNTLKILVEHGAVVQLTIDERTACYDGIVTPHAHFLCRKCGKVYDVPLKRKSLLAMAEMPCGFKPDGAWLYFKGTCSKCLAKDDDLQGASGCDSMA